MIARTLVEMKLGSTENCHADMCKSCNFIACFIQQNLFYKIKQFLMLITLFRDNCIFCKRIVLSRDLCF